MGICCGADACLAAATQGVLLPDADIVAHMKQCRDSAQETVELCASTLSTGRSLVECGETIQSSLMGAASDLSAESFAVIADLIDGDKAHEARGLAEDMQGKSTECISLSMKMVASLEQSVDALPDVIESYIEKKAQQSVTDELTPEERQMAEGIDGDAEELTACIDAVENLKLVSAVEAGTRGFEAIKVKSSLCEKIFAMIKRFANDVLSITDAISNMDAAAILEKIKDGSILKAIGLSKYIKQFADGCRKIMDKVIELFHGAAGKLSTLWRALSHAKDVMVGSLSEVGNARSLCSEAAEKTEQLKQMTATFANIEALRLVKSLSGEKSRSMDRAVGTAQDVDRGMEEAMSKMKHAAVQVGEEFRNLPDMITDGVTDDTDDEVTGSFGEKLRDIEGDIQGLETATQHIEESNLMNAAVSIHREIKDIPDKVDSVRAMVDSCTDFADMSNRSIDSFLGQWSLETAVEHIKEMCRLVSFSKLMEQLAERVGRLIKAITTLLRAMSAKIQSVAENLGAGGLDLAVDSLKDAAGDMVADGLNSVIGKMFT